MSVIDEIKELESQKQKLLNKAKSEALKAANAAIRDLNSLGFEYHLAEGAPKKSAAKPVATKGKRRPGVRDTVHKAIAKAENGLSRKELIILLKAEEKSAKIAISNALATLKKAGTITNTNGKYRAG